MRIRCWWIAGLAALYAAAVAGEVRLYVFDCGRLAYDSPQRFGFGFADAATDRRELSVPCYVIEHPRGRLLWEGGLSPALAGRGWVEKKTWRMRLDEPLGVQLATLGLDLASFDYAAFSHMHFDHAGVANDLRGATLLLQRREYDAFFVRHKAAARRVARYAELLALPRRLLDGDHDVFGDGRVVLLAAPGHTPGHQTLWVELAATGPVLLAGDLYHFKISRMLRAVPRFNASRAASLASMDALERRVRRRGAALWIGHDVELFRRLRKAPDYYR